MPPFRSLSLEALERRDLLAVFGVAWPDAGHLTLSFSPDGTSTAGGGSDLFAQLGGSTGSTAWQLEVLRAIQTWAVNANINVGLVSDDGSAFGTLGPAQGSPTQGDIRLGSAALDGNRLALGGPYNPSSGWSGEVLFNSLEQFSVGGGGTGADVFTVALHEFGHVMGIGDNHDTTSAMYENYQGPRTGLSPGDVARLLTLYDPRGADVWEGTTGNNTPGTATPLSLGGVLDADLGSPSDVDCYKVQAATTGAFTVALRTSGISLLEGRLSVLDSSGNVLATAQASDPRQGDLAVTVNGQAGATYIVRVDGPSGDVFDVGAYRLAVGTAAVGSVLAAAGPINPVAFSNATPATATVLPQRYATVDDHNDYLARGSLDAAGDIHYYQVQAPQNQTGGQVALAVTAWDPAPQTFSPVITVYNPQGKVVADQILRADGWTCTVRIPKVQRNTTYYVAVSGTAQTGWSGVGNYGLSADFQSVAAPSFSVGSNLNASHPQNFTSLTVNQAQLFHFELSGQQGGGASPSGVQMVIFDSKNNVVFTTVALPGATSRNDVWLFAGTYTVRFWAFSVLGGRIGPVDFSLQGYAALDAIGLTTTDTTTTDTGTSTNSTTTGTSTSYTWTTASTLTLDPTLLNSTDPYSTSWWL